MDTREARLARRGYPLLTLLILAVGLALAAFRLGDDSLWLDESYTWWFTRLDWGDLLRAARIDAVNPPLYYVYAKAFAISNSESSLRLPSVIAQLAGIAGAMVLGQLLGGRPGSIAAGLLWATHPLTLWAARDARPYALGAALGVAAVALFFRLQRSWSTRLAAVAGVDVALGLLTHYFFFVLAATLVLLAAADLRRSPTFFRRWTVLILLALLPLAAWLVWFFSMGSPSLGIGWIRLPVPADIPQTLWNLASGYGGVPDVWSALFGLAIIGIAAAGLAGGRRADRLKIAALGLVTPVVAVWLVSQRRPVYVDRYFVVLLPFVAALVGAGAQSIAERRRAWPSRGARAFKGMVVVGLAAASLASGWSVLSAGKFEKEDWRGLAAFLQENKASRNSLSLSEPEIALPLSYYFDASTMNESPRLIPACGDGCWWVLRQPYTATHALTQSVHEPGRSEAPDTPAGCSRGAVWSSPTGLEAAQVTCSQ